MHFPAISPSLSDRVTFIMISIIIYNYTTPQKIAWLFILITNMCRWWYCCKARYCGEISWIFHPCFYTTKTVLDWQCEYQYVISLNLDWGPRILWFTNHSLEECEDKTSQSKGALSQLLFVFYYMLQIGRTLNKHDGHSQLKSCFLLNYWWFTST